jgi:phage protein D
MKPVFRIFGTGIASALIADRLLSLTITDEAGTRSDSLEFVLDDRDNRLAEPAHGAVLKCWLGFASTTLAFMGRYTVDEVVLAGPHHRITIRARAVDLRGAMKAAKERSWDETSLGKIVTTIASEYELQPLISNDLAARAIAHVDQTESDLHFLTRLAREHDAITSVKNGNLVFASIGEETNPQGQPRRVIRLVPGDLTSWRMVKGDRSRAGKIKARWHNPDTGLDVMESAGDGDPTRLLPGIQPNQEAAQQAADSALKRTSRQGGDLELELAIGNPALMAERTISLNGFRTGINGKWIIKRAEHRLEGALMTSVTAEPA